MSAAWSRMLRAMTPAEQTAIRRYQLDYHRIERQHDGERRLRLWAGILRDLRNNAAGSPLFDAYVTAQQTRWLGLKTRVDEAAA